MKLSSKLLAQDARTALLRLAPRSVHAVITDPPADIPYLTKDRWNITNRHDLLVKVLECAAPALVPGAFALVWSLPKEQHRTALALELAGYRVLDIITHHFGTGQPKSGRLKPATEFWTLAQYKQGRQLNITECMILDPANLPMRWSKPRGGFWQANAAATGKLVPNPRGRWPANVILDEAMAELLPRFFYVQKPLMGAKNGHPTQKPLGLMRYLVRLVTVAGDTVLDPFAGSGSTGLAALTEQRNFIGIEIDKKYAAMATQLLKAVV